MGLNFDLSMFHIKLTAAIIYTVGSLFAFAMFPMFNGAAQGFHLEARQDGSCETKAGVRFDRVVVMSGQTFSTASATVTGFGTNPTPPFNGATGEETDPNQYDWSKAHSVSPQCAIESTGWQINGDDGALTYTFKLLAADGTELTGQIAGTVATANTAVDATSTVAEGAKYASPANFLQDNRTITNVVIGVLVLIIGVGPIAILGGIGKYLLDTFAGNMSGAMKFLVATLGAVIAITLLGIFVDFIDIAYDAVDSNRFTMYDVNIASLAGTLKQYWGLIFIAGWVSLGSYFGWQAFQKIRGRGQGMGSQVMG